VSEVPVQIDTGTCRGTSLTRKRPYPRHRCRPLEVATQRLSCERGTPVHVRAPNFRIVALKDSDSTHGHALDSTFGLDSSWSTTQGLLEINDTHRPQEGPMPLSLALQ
jgi:hypothetical protein